MTVNLSSEPSDRLARARESLEGLSVGDAFGELFIQMAADAQAYFINNRHLPPMPMRYTDDTNMALSIYALLRDNGSIEHDALARHFAEHFEANRGYGQGARRLLKSLQEGTNWQTASKQLFSGQGSFGNGGAMRVAPLGAYFADDLDRVVSEARKSAEVTHAHVEGIAGAIAIAVAASYAARLRGDLVPTRRAFLEMILPHVPKGLVYDNISQAREFPTGVSVDHLAMTLGNGSQVSAQDTVGYCLWCAGEKLGNYEDALWLTVSGSGDTDTCCAIVGGIVSAYTGAGAIPGVWLESREALPSWGI